MNFLWINIAAASPDRNEMRWLRRCVMSWCMSWVSRSRSRQLKIAQTDDQLYWYMVEYTGICFSRNRGKLILVEMTLQKRQFLIIFARKPSSSSDADRTSSLIFRYMYDVPPPYTYTIPPTTTLSKKIIFRITRNYITLRILFSITFKCNSAHWLALQQMHHDLTCRTRRPRKR